MDNARSQPVDVYANNSSLTFGIFDNPDLNLIAQIPELRMIIFRSIGDAEEPSETLMSKAIGASDATDEALFRAGLDVESRSLFLRNGKFDLYLEVKY